MKVAVIGVGYWGPNLIRNFLSWDEVENVIACDRIVGAAAKGIFSFRLDLTFLQAWFIEFPV